MYRNIQDAMKACEERNVHQERNIKMDKERNITFMKRDSEFIKTGGMRLSNENYKLLYEILRDEFRCFTPGKIIKSQGAHKVIEAVEICWEGKYINRLKISNMGGYFMGTLSKLKVA